MLLVKKINSRKEYDSIKAGIPDVKIWGISNKGNLCQVALPQEKSFLGISVSDGKWDNIYFFPTLKSNEFILKMKRAVQEDQHTHLTQINVQINDWNYMADMSQIIAWTNSHNGELTLETLEKELADAKNTLFDYLQEELKNPRPGIVQSADVDEQIKTIAQQKDWLSRFFPWFKVEKVFVDSTRQKTPEEEALIAKMNEQAERRRTLDMQLAQERTESEYKISIAELENDEAEQLFAFQLREKERQQALYQKDCELQLAEEIGLLTKKQTAEKIQFEIEENRHNAKLEELEYLRQQQEQKNKTEAEAREHEDHMKKLQFSAEAEAREHEDHMKKLQFSAEAEAKEHEDHMKKLQFSAEAEAKEHEDYMKKLQLSAEVEEKEHALRLIQLQLSQDKTEQEREQLKLQGEIALQEFELASARKRQEMSDLECQQELNRVKTELERAKYLSDKAKVESEQEYWKKQSELWRQVLNTPDVMFLIDRVGMNFQENDPMKYTKPVVMAKFQKQQQNSDNRITVNCRSVQQQARGLSCKKQNVMEYGTEMVFSLNVPMDGYLTMLLFEADGNVQLLLPNFYNVTPRVTKGTYTFPDAACTFIPTDVIQQTARVGGQEHIVVIVSDKPLFNDINFENTDDFIYLNSIDYQNFIDKLYAQDLKWAVGYTHYVVVNSKEKNSSTAPQETFELQSRGIF